MEETDTLRQALEKMEHHGYAAVPLLSTEGKYLGTLTDGDVLWGLKELNFPSLYQMEEIPVMQVNRFWDNKPVHVDVDSVTVNGQVCTQRGKKIRPGDTVVYENNEYGVQYEDQ